MNNGRAKIETNSNGRLKVNIPSRKNWFALIFGTFWLGGWLFGIIMALATLGKSENGLIDGFMLFWICGWLVGGLAITFFLLWGYFGQEVLEFDFDEVHFKRTVFNIGTKRVLNKRDIKDFNFEKTTSNFWNGDRSWAVWGLGEGKIKFDYGLKTYSFGLSLDDAEAKYLVEKLNQQL